MKAEQAQPEHGEGDHGEHVSGEPAARRERRRALQGGLVREGPESWVQDEEHAGQRQGGGTKTNSPDRGCANGQFEKEGTTPVAPLLRVLSSRSTRFASCRLQSRQRPERRLRLVESHAQSEAVGEG